MSHPLAVATHTQSYEITPDEVLVFDGGTLHLLVGSSAKIWKLVDGRRSADKVAELIVEMYDSEATVPSDVLAFLTDLLSRGLLSSLPVVPEPDEYHFLVPPYVGWVANDGTVLISDFRSGTFESFNDSAARLWLLIVGGTNYRDLVERLEQNSGVTGQTLRDDVHAFVSLLVDRGLMLAT